MKNCHSVEICYAWYHCTVAQTVTTPVLNCSQSLCCWSNGEHSFSNLGLNKWLPDIFIQFPLVSRNHSRWLCCESKSNGEQQDDKWDIVRRLNRKSQPWWQKQGHPAGWSWNTPRNRTEQRGEKGSCLVDEKDQLWEPKAVGRGIIRSMTQYFNTHYVINVYFSD